MQKGARININSCSAAFFYVFRPKFIPRAHCDLDRILASLFVAASILDSKSSVDTVKETPEDKELIVSPQGYRLTAFLLKQVLPRWAAAHLNAISVP
jgi:hypothetical protein